MNITRRIAAVAARLGMAPREIADVYDSPAGEVVSYRSGSVSIAVPASHPDADGKTGLMWLVAPSDSYNGPTPVFSQPGVDDLVFPDTPALAMEGAR